MNANDNFDKRHTGKFFEEFITCGDQPKCLGVRVVESNTFDRPLGSAGIRYETLRSYTTLQRGHREVVIKASCKRPVKVFTMLQKLEGAR